MGYAIMFTKKAAMFGLDARIALAIFGALSVISGAALYSAIQQAKVTSMLVSVQEVGKAYEQYYLDTGLELPQYDTSLDWQKSERVGAELISSTKPGWAGPYLPYKISTNDAKRIEYNQDSEFRILYLNNKTTWGNTNSWTPSAYCTSTLETCSLWINFNYKPVNQELVNSLDLLVDGSIDGTSGNFKWIIDPSSISSIMFLKILPVNFTI